MHTFADLLRLLSFLREQKVTFRIDHLRPGEVTVFFTLVGERIEATFSAAGFGWKVYEGHEDLFTREQIEAKLPGALG